MYKIVVAVGDDEVRALDQAETVARLAQSGLDVEALLLHVFQNNPRGASVHQLASVKRAREYLAERNVSCELFSESGDPATTILEFASEHDASAICVAGRKQSPSRKVVFGSVTQSVLLSSDRPVFVPEMDEPVEATD